MCDTTGYAIRIGAAPADFDQNIIAIYSNVSLGWADHIPGAQQLRLAASTRLTDDYAPVEALQQRCSVS